MNQVNIQESNVTSYRFGWRSYLIILFIFEAIAGKANIFNIHVPFMIHMTLTAIFIVLIFIASLSVSRNLRDFTSARHFKNVRICIRFLIIWAFLSCLFQDLMTANYFFWALWAANLYVIFWSIPKIFANFSSDQKLYILNLIFALCVFGSIILIPSGGHNAANRFSGIFGNPTWAGRFCALALVFWVTRAVIGGKTNSWLIVAICSSAVLLTMTRTRASIAAALLGIFATIFIAMFDKQTEKKLGAARSIVILILVAIATGIVFISGYIKQDRLISYLRLEGGVREQYSTSRAMNWEKGYKEYWSYGLFGKGLLSKYGDKSNTFKVMGVKFPTYDWTTDADPLNSFLSVSQQVGIPGGIIFVIFLLILFFMSLRLSSFEKYTMISILIPGLVFGFLDGNWLTSFGDPVDRLSMVTFGIILTGSKVPGPDYRNIQ